MYMLKLFRNYRSGPPWLLGKQPTSWGTAKDYPLGTNWRHPDLVFQGETDDHCPWEQLTAQDRDVAASLT